MTNQQSNAAASIPNPLSGQTNPSDGSSSSVGVQEVEVQFLGGLLKTVIKTVLPLGLNALRSHISSMPAAAQQDSTEVAQEVQDFEAQIFPALGVLLPGIIGAIPEVIKAFRGQAAGADVSASGAGAVQAAAR